MRFVILGGAGAVGAAVVRDLLACADVQQVVIADIDLQRAEKLAAACATPRAVPRALDVRNAGEVRAILRSADVAVNCAFYRYNLALTEAAIEAGIHLVDLGFRPEHTQQQLELDQAAKEAGVLVVPGLGVTPGLSNVLAIHAAKGMDRVEGVTIAYASIRPFAMSPSLIDAALDNYTGHRPTYRMGALIEVPPFDGEEDIHFPAPVGRQRVYCVPHSEPLTLREYIAGAQSIEVKGTYHKDVMEAIRVLTALGLHEAEAIEVNGAAVVPRDVLRFLLLRSSTLASESVRPLFALRVQVTGTQGADSLRRSFDVLQSTGCAGTNALTMITGVPASITAQMIARGQITATGVMPPEAVIATQPFLAELGSRGITIHECEERRRMLPVGP